MRIKQIKKYFQQYQEYFIPLASGLLSLILGQIIHPRVVVVKDRLPKEEAGRTDSAEAKSPKRKPVQRSAIGTIVKLGLFAAAAVGAYRYATQTRESRRSVEDTKADTEIQADDELIVVSANAIKIERIEDSADTIQK